MILIVGRKNTMACRGVFFALTKEEEAKLLAAPDSDPVVEIITEESRSTGIVNRISNPEGIVAISPGLRGTSYPGKPSQVSTTLQGLRQIS